MIMPTIIKDFILNLSFVFLLYFVYYGYIEGKIKNRYSNELFIGVLSVLAIVLCMTFPAYPITGFIFDMRQVPFIIGALYGGRRVALSLLIVIISYRFFLGLDAGFYVTVVMYAILFLVLLYAIPLFKKANLTKEKVKITLVCSVFGKAILAISLYFFGISNDLSVIMSLLIVYGSQTVGIVLFVTYIERAKKEQLMIGEIKKLEKLRVVSDIAASISHEVRNPLTVTKGFLQLLREPGLPPEKQRMYADLSLDELERAESTISDYLTFAKPSLENTEILDLEKELEYLNKVMIPYANMHSVDVVVEVKHKLFIVGERQKLHQCLINLSKNAIEAMPDGGCLNVILEEQEGRVVITIIDTGVGMNSEQVNRLGTPYYSTKDKGTGLGTMVVYSIVKIMNGEMNVESEVGKGTTFTLSFPKMDPTS
ncbi:ATP-binding protein [Bacillus sp. FJAT-45350]|uniref:ATP-binding protein n=1 Tax=Bacillus sp. FJAT-45350 TaxID=2011014 RepID=UPI000BB7E82E|nr:sensor histidine kinase [Bacillus sp. FJAT-45350]